MKPIVYFFGTMPGGLCSYPQDHTKKIFEGFIAKSKNNSQIVLHRKDNLLHYGYVRRMHDNKYFGICLCLDCIYKDVNLLFYTFDNIYVSMVKNGDVLKIDENKSVDWATKDFVSETVAITEYTKQLIDAINVSAKNTLPLPPIDFSISINDCLELSVQESAGKILDATKRYCNLYIVQKEWQIERLSSYHQVIRQKNDEIRTLTSAIENQKKVNAELSNKLIMAKAKQRNMIWVALLGAAVLILFFVLWNKVLFPSEVTHYETGEFVYYGPIKDKKPHGEGVAFYPEDDADGRRYYIGHFANGERQDSEAMLYYQNGNYFYGAMDGDKLIKGIFYSNSDHSHFEGSFIDNHPYEGTWYYHEESYRLKDGKMEGNDSSLVKQ